jgi:hypothetical protein
MIIISISSLCLSIPSLCLSIIFSLSLDPYSMFLDLVSRYLLSVSWSLLSVSRYLGSVSVYLSLSVVLILLLSLCLCLSGALSHIQFSTPSETCKLNGKMVELSINWFAFKPFCLELTMYSEACHWNIERRSSCKRS